MGSVINGASITVAFGILTFQNTVISCVWHCRRIRWFLLVTALNAAVYADAQTISKEELMSSYVYNFAKNIEWPASQSEEFTIGLYRVDNPRLEEALLYLNTGFKVRNQRVRVTKVNTLKSLENYNLVFTEQVGLTTINNIYGVIENKPVLLVTSEFTSQPLVMINLKFLAEKRMVFEVNKSNILNQGLKPLPELILNGGTEIDVAKLFREGQSSLIRMQNQMKSREDLLKSLSEKISKQENQNQTLENRLMQLGESIQESYVLINEQARELEHQNDQIIRNKQEREALLSEVEKSDRELEKQEAELIKSQIKLGEIQSSIDEKEKRLRQLNEVVANQEDLLSQQEGEISLLDETVSTQQTTLMYLKVIVALAIALVATAAFAYQTKKKDNQRLAAHSHDLQMARDRLSIAKKRAEEASQAKSHFLSLMSHELRTPLQAIIGYTDVVLDELKMSGEPEHVDDLTRVINNSERLLRLINSVLDLAKIESGQMELHLSDVKMSTLVDEAVGSVKPQIEKNNNQLEVTVTESHTPPKADPEKLLHILINLLSNAAKFTENGVINLSVNQNEKDIEIRVSDTGIGMTPDQKKNIFDRFRQADSSQTRRYQGSGLGLSIVKQFSELMGGRIEVGSVVDKGSMFCINIPLPIPRANH